MSFQHGMGTRVRGRQPVMFSTHSLTHDQLKVEHCRGRREEESEVSRPSWERASMSHTRLLVN